MEKSFAKPFHEKPQLVLQVGERECISQDNATSDEQTPKSKA